MCLSGYPLSVPRSHFYPTLSVCTPLPLSLSFPIWVPSSHCPWLSLQHPFPSLLLLPFSSRAQHGPSRLPLIAQSSWVLSTPPAAAVLAQAHLSPSTQAHHTAVVGLSAHQGSGSCKSYFIFIATLGQQPGYTHLTVGKTEAPKGKKNISMRSGIQLVLIAM